MFFDNDNWWANIVRGKYHRHDTFLETKAKQNHSLAWKDSLGSRDIISKGMSWLVSDGKDIMFWTHNWVFPHPLFHLILENQRH